MIKHVRRARHLPTGHAAMLELHTSRQPVWSSGHILGMHCTLHHTASSACNARHKLGLCVHAFVFHLLHCLQAMLKDQVRGMTWSAMADLAANKDVPVCIATRQSCTFRPLRPPFSGMLEDLWPAAV
jgi:hypothetical protein